MLLRTDSRGVLAIGQASHAWLSGQLARAWGNEQLGDVVPREPLCLAAEQHDVGMAAWDLEPTRNPSTGLPHAFTEMPLATHLECWTAGPRRLITQSRYAALLTCAHGAWLYEQRDLARLPAADADAVRAFLGRQRALQDELLVSLRADPLTAAAASPELVARNRGLIRTWDFLSLALCLDWAPTAAAQVPGAAGELELRLNPGAAPSQLRLDPWPFTDDAVTVQAEGRRLVGPYETDRDMHAALSNAAWETVRFELSPG